jgi:hypothetical protein
MATGGDQTKLNALIDHKIKEMQAEQAAAHPPAQARFALAHLTGTDKFTLTQAERDEIKQYINSGGTLVVDAAGGSSAFASSAEKELALILGEASVTSAIAAPLPLTDRLYTLSSAPIDTVRYRSFAKQTLGSSREPRICGIVQNGRVVAYYSREDLSAGLVGQQVDGIDGYDPETATAIMRNIVLLAASSR